MSHNRLLTVNVLLESADAARVDFGVPLIAGSSMGAGFTEDSRSYSSQDDVDADDDLGATLTAILTDMFAQARRPQLIKVGKLATLVAEETDLAIDTAGTDGEDWTVTVLGEQATYTQQALDTPTAIASGLKTAIDALSLPVTVVDDLAGTLTLTANNTGQPLGLSVDAEALTGTSTLTTTTEAVTVGDGLTALRNAGVTFYAVVLESQRAWDIEQAAAWVEPRRHLLIAQSDDADILTDGAGNIAETLNDGDYDHSALVYHSTPTEFPSAAWAGQRLTFNPDAFATVWDKAKLDGFAALNVNTTQETNLLANNVNWFDEFKGIDVMSNGQVASGLYIDEIILKHWLEDRLEADLAELMTDVVERGEKIEFTNRGIAQIGQVIESRLIRARSIGHIESFAVTLPRIEDVSAVDRAARVLTVSFSAVPTGAVQDLTINGNVAVPTT